MPPLDVITTGRPDLTARAQRHGCLRGTRLDKEPAYRKRGIRVDFLDLHWADPDSEDLVEAAAWHRPKYVVAGDYEHRDDDGELVGDPAEVVNERARRLREHAENVIVVPHTPGQVEHVPEWAVVGYSTPTTYGGTEAPIWEYRGRDLHILGGTPHQQLDILGYLGSDVVSVDGNSYHKAATKGAKYWRDDPAKHWHRVDQDGPEAVVSAYARSIRNWVGALERRGWI